MEPNKQLRMSLTLWPEVCSRITETLKDQSAVLYISADVQKQSSRVLISSTPLGLKFVTIVTMSSLIRRVSAPCDVDIINIFYECLSCYSDSSREIVLMIIGSERKQKHWVLVAAGRCVFSVAHWRVLMEDVRLTCLIWGKWSHINKCGGVKTSHQRKYRHSTDELSVQGVPECSISRFMRCWK